MSDLHKKALLGMMPSGMLPPRPPGGGHGGGPHGKADSSKSAAQQRGKRDYTLIPWTTYFDKYEEISTDADSRFRVYVKGTEGPAFFFLHGGGFSGLSWCLLSSSLTSKIKCRCFSLDIRGHGSSVTNNDEDLSIETLTNDVVSVINTMWKETESPQIVLVGHSMGGAIAVHVAATGLIKNLAGLVVIDVVEGSALDALSSMQSFLQGRPKIFNSIEQAIEYHVRSGAIRNVESARVSIIGQLKKLEDSSNAVQEKNEPSANLVAPNISHVVMSSKIAEEEEEEGETAAKSAATTSPKKTESEPDDAFKKPLQPTASSGDRYGWRIDLTKTEKFWKDWFRGLSSLFLSVNAPKLLLLAGVDRLDKELMVGQMQGKFQMQVLPLCGHAVHEDAPEDVADALAHFMLRYRLTQALDSASISGPKLSC